MSYMNFGIWIPQGDTNKEELYSLLNNWFCYIEDKSLFDKVYNFCPDMWDKFLGYFSDIKCETLLNYNKAEKISNLKKAFDDDYFFEDDDWFVRMSSNLKYANICFKSYQKEE